MDEPVIILCPTCGAECTSEAAFCGACGSALEQPAARETQAAAPFAASNDPLPADVTTPAEATAVPETAPPMAANPPPVEPPVPTTDPAPSAAAGATRRCNWCGAESPAEAKRCAKCGAMFPTPDTDAAYMAAAEERIRGVQESLEQMRRNWRRRGFGRLFED